MAKVNQVIAIEKGVTSKAMSELTELYHAMQKPDMFVGISRKYTPNDAEDEKLPDEVKLVQRTAADVLRGIMRAGSARMDIVARKEWSNASGTVKSDVVVDGNTVVKDAPVTYLLFLEKLLTDLRTELVKMPVLDSSDVWNLDQESGLYKTNEVIQYRTKKVQKPVVLLQPTPEHPGQAVMVTEDVQVGKWGTTKSSGAMKSEDKRQILDRIEKLMNAVKTAREEANNVEEVSVENVSEPVFSYLFPELK